MTTIPASMDVNVTPGVLSAGGRGLVLNSVFITESARVPMGLAVSFATSLAVSAYFGPTSYEYALSLRYFQGYTNSFMKPSRLFFARYAAVAAAAWLRGGSILGLTTAQLAAKSGSLSIVIDQHYTWSAASIDLAGTTSPSDAADAIEAALIAVPPIGATCDAGTIAGTVLTVAGATLTGTFRVGQIINGTGVTANSKIISLGTGTGGAGTYNLSAASTVAVGELITAHGAPPVVTFDPISGGFLITSSNTGLAVSGMGFATGTLAAGIMLTQATGAVTSQGGDATTPSVFMTGLIQVTQNFATFMTTFDPDNGSGNDLKYAFAEWNGFQNNRWNYVCWDTDASPAVVVPATTSLGARIAAAEISGTSLVWNTPEIAAFRCGAAASLDFARTNGRASMKFRRQSGLVPSVTDITTAQNLIDNGYNYYGAVATANDQFNYYSPGQVSGEFLWDDSYLNEIWFNAALQLSVLTLLLSVGAVPYVQRGYDMVELAMGDPIIAAGNFGAFSPGVPLSEEQQAAVNAQAGKNITSSLFVAGYYVLINPATAQTRALRGSPPITVWYCDAGSIHKIDIASISIQ